MTTTNTSCGAACWYAKEQACRCSCGGSNHGLLLTDSGAETPRRNCTIAGTRYILGMMGTYGEATGELRALLLGLDRATYGRPYALRDGGTGYRPPKANVGGGVAWLRSPTDAQSRWPEVEAWVEAHRFESVVGRFVAPLAQLLWVREDCIEHFDRPGVIGEQK